MTAQGKCARFDQLHASDELFVMPNPWDAGSAVRLEQMGFKALATTSSGFAASLGRTDGEVSLDELVAHTAALAQATSVPLNVDAERCFAESSAAIAETVHRLAEAGAAGLSIEDWGPDTGIDPVSTATQRVAAAVAAANEEGLVLTARAENHIRGVDNIADTISRLLAYRDAGAHCLYAPGILSADDIAQVLNALDGAPLNVLAMAQTPPITELADLGVRRVSTGGALAFGAYKAMVEQAQPFLM